MKGQGKRWRDKEEADRSAKQRFRGAKRPQVPGGACWAKTDCSERKKPRNYYPSPIERLPETGGREKEMEAPGGGS